MISALHSRYSQGDKHKEKKPHKDSETDIPEYKVQKPRDPDWRPSAERGQGTEMGQSSGEHSRHGSSGTRPKRVTWRSTRAEAKAGRGTRV